MLPARAEEFQPSITRFVPGRDGFPYTTDLAALATRLDAEGRRVIEHHWGAVVRPSPGRSPDRPANHHRGLAAIRGAAVGPERRGHRLGRALTI
jgi:hypothetical protein